MDKYLSRLGLCRRAGMLCCGFDAVKGAISRNEAKLIVTASDLSSKTKKEILFALHQKQEMLFTIPNTMEEIESVLGKRVGVIALLDENFAKLMQQ